MGRQIETLRTMTTQAPLPGDVDGLHASLLYGPARSIGKVRRQQRVSPYIARNSRSVSLESGLSEDFVATQELVESLLDQGATNGGVPEIMLSSTGSSTATPPPPSSVDATEGTPKPHQAEKRNIIPGLKMQRSGVSDLMEHHCTTESRQAGASDDDCTPIQSLEEHTSANSSQSSSFSKRPLRPRISPPEAPPASASDADSGHALVPSGLGLLERPVVRRMRSKGEALVDEALSTLAVGRHKERGPCPFMEDSDAYLIRRHDVPGGAPIALFGVYDGHGGDAAARYLSRHLLPSIDAHLSADPHVHAPGEHDDEASLRALVAGFGACERALLAAACPAGAAAVVLMMQRGGRALNLAWCGDCRAVLCRAGKPLDLTSDHRTTNPSESARAQSEGGVIIDGRLGDALAVTRSFGNAWVEPQDGPTATPKKLAGLTALPECHSEALCSDDEFVILASDGLWDVVSSADATRIVRSELAAYDDAQIAAEKLIEVALRRRADDNITATVVPLFAPPTAPASVAGRSQPVSFVHLKTPSSFVRVVGGFD